MGRKFSLPGEDDDRTPHEQARDLGIIPDDYYPDKLIIDKPEWLTRGIAEGPARRGKKPDDSNVRVNKINISFSPKAMKWMGNPDRLIVGFNRYKDDVILTLRPGKSGYKLNVGQSRPSIINPALLEELHAKGLRMGAHELCRAKGQDFYVAIPIE